MKKRLTEEQITGFQRKAETGIPIKELCWRHGFSEASYYRWRSKFGGMSVPDAKRPKELEAENARLKKLLVESLLENGVTREALRKNVVCAPSRRELVRRMTQCGLSERRALRVVGMNASAYRCQQAPDRNVALRAHIVALAQRHRRYGSGMIYLKLRQSGQESITSESSGCMRKRNCRCVAASARRCRFRSPTTGGPSAADQAWSMDFVFDRTAEGRVIKSLTVVDDATHEAVAIVPERAISGHGLTRILDSVALHHELPQAIRTDNGKEFCGRATLT